MLVVLFSGKTRFDPEEVTIDPAFPNNLQGVDLAVRGRILTAEGCLLVADRVIQGPPARAAASGAVPPNAKGAEASPAVPIPPPVRVIQSPAPLPPAAPRRSTFRPSLPGAPD